MSAPPVYPPGFRNHSGWGWWPEPPCTCDAAKLRYSQRHIGRQPTYQTGDRFVLNEKQDAMVGCEVDPVEQSWSLGYWYSAPLDAEVLHARKRTSLRR